MVLVKDVRAQCDPTEISLRVLCPFSHCKFTIECALWQRYPRATKILKAIQHNLHTVCTVCVFT